MKPEINNKIKERRNDIITLENLKAQPIWVNWRYEERKDKDGEIKKTKPPINPHTGKLAKSNDPKTWADFNSAQRAAANYEGVGFMFADGICGIDIDNKAADPQLDKQADIIINYFDTYTERSPSGTGWHIILTCDVSQIPTVNGKLDSKYYSKNPYNGLECYLSGLDNRYFTFTEQGNGKPIADRTERVKPFLDKFMLKENFKKKPESNPASNKEPQGRGALPMSEPDVIERIRKSQQGYKFSALFDRGDTSAYNNDWNAADLALCNILAWWLQGDYNAVDYYFRQSRLYREKWERSDYRTGTISKAVDMCGGNYKRERGRPKNEKPKREYTEAERELLDEIIDRYGVYHEEKITISGVAYHLASKDITTKYNETTRQVDMCGGDNDNYAVEGLPVDIYNELNLQYKKCSLGIVQDYIRRITMKNAYNPVLELIEGGAWDGVDRFFDLLKIIRVADDDFLSHTLIYKWLWQNLSMLRNFKGAFGADGLLVIKGGQGLGKTTFARKASLRDEFFGEGMTLDVRDKDSVITAVSCWIGELGEIESTFKSDISALKAFITRAIDRFRVPYGRVDEANPRRTSYIGTCNSDEYLIDETGNRRFWTIPINERMDLDALKNFDMLQLYRQIDVKAKQDIQGFRLTYDEISQLGERNSRHEKPLKGELEVRDILAGIKDTDSKQELTVSAFKNKFPILNKFDVRQIGQVLNKLGIKKRKTNGVIIYEFPIEMLKTGYSDWNAEINK